MIREIHTSAPGKMLLLGEYAVLEGAPALVMAVERRAHVRLRANASDRHRVSAPGIGDTALRIDGDGAVHWEGDTRLPLLETVLRCLLERGVIPDAEPLQRGCDMTLDTSAFYTGAHTKLGFGSSAGLTVALASALAVWAGRGSATANRRIWLEELLHVHRAFQGGRGSGADIAASLLGGLVDYRLQREGDELHPAFRTARLPEALVCRFVWTGQPAVTGDFLQRLEGWRDAHRDDYRARMDALGAIANAAADTAHALRPDCAAFLDAAAAYARALDDFGQAVGLPVFSDEHRALAKLAAEAGVVYKPCGAGGGDFGIALCDDHARMDAALEAMRRSGFEPMELPPAPQGLRLDY